ERAIALTRAGGRLGLVLPSGLATDHGSAALRRLLFSRSRIDAIVGMDNHRGVFPIHRSVRFLLITASMGEATERIACRLGVDGKHVEPFHVALDTVRRRISAVDARRLLRGDRHEHPRLAYRDVASATNRLTLIAAVLPAQCVSTHTVFCLRTPLPIDAQHLL